VEGDFEKPESLAAALKGVARALLVSSPHPRQAELQNNFIDAAKRAGQVHLVKISSVCVEPDSPVSFFRWHAETERRLIGSGLPYTILQPNFFMQNTFAFAGTIVKDGKFYGSMRDGRTAMVDIRDIAAVAAQTLTGSGHAGKTYVITGSESLSFADAASKLSAVLGRTVSYVDLPPAALVSALMAIGLPDWQATGVGELQELLSQNAAAAATDVVEKIGGKGPILFDQFARDFRTVFESTASAR